MVMKGEKRFVDPMDAPDVKSTRWYQEKNIDANAEDVTDEDLDIESIAARNETPNLKEKMAAEMAAEQRIESVQETRQKPKVESVVESIEINAEAPKTPEVIVAKAESSLFSRLSSGMRDVVSKAAGAYESLKNVGTIDNGEGGRIEVGARASVTDMKRGVADFFADMRTTLFGKTEVQTVDIRDGEKSNQSWEVKAEVHSPGLFGELISRLPDAPEAAKRIFLSVAVDVPKGIYDSWKRDKELSASLEQTLKEEYGEDYTLDMWRAKEEGDKLEFTPDAIRARQAAQDEAYFDGLIEAPTFMQTLRQDAVTIVGTGAEAMKNMHIAIGRAAKFALYEEPMDLLRGYGLIAESLVSDAKRGAEAVKGKAKEAAEGAKNAANNLKEGVAKLQTKAEKALGDYKEKTWGAKAKRDTALRASATDRLIDFGGVTKMTNTDRDRLVAGRVFSLEKQIGELKAAVEKGESHKKRLLLAFERVQKNAEAREAVLHDIKQAIASESVDVAKNKNRLIDLQNLLDAYTEKITPVELPAAEIDAADEITEEMPRPTQESA